MKMHDLIRDRATSTHYQWGDHCDGWFLVNSPELTIIEERMPSGTAEKSHYHLKAEQFFRILSGVATFVLSGEHFEVEAGSGLYVPPLTIHQIRNDHQGDLVFLVLSRPSTQGDRIEEQQG